MKKKVWKFCASLVINQLQNKKIKKEKMQELNNYKGFELFTDILDDELRTRNQAVVLANIAEDHTKKKLITAKGASLILGYFQNIREADRNAVKNKFAENMKQRGFAIAS